MSKLAGKVALIVGLWLAGSIGLLFATVLIDSHFIHPCGTMCEPARAMTRNDVVCDEANRTISLKAGHYREGLDRAVELCGWRAMIDEALK